MTTISRVWVWVSHVGGSVLGTWATLCCLSQAFVRELGQKWSSQDRNHHPYWMLKWQMAATSYVRPGPYYQEKENSIVH